MKKRKDVEEKRREHRKREGRRWSNPYACVCMYVVIYVCVYLLISCHKRNESLLVIDSDELANTPFCKLSTLSTAARGDSTFKDPPDQTYLCRLINLPWCVSMFTREYIVITGITSSPADPVDPVDPAAPVNTP